MTTAEGLTVDITVKENDTGKVRTGKQEVCTMKPVGKENVAKCIKSIGQYIIDNAEKFSENIDRTVEINIYGNISVNELPTVEVVYTNQIPDMSMVLPTKREE